MAYAASIERLLETLHARAPAKVDALALEKRRVPHGLLSVGLKLHCLGDEHLFRRLINALGGVTSSARASTDLCIAQSCGAASKFGPRQPATTWPSKPATAAMISKPAKNQVMAFSE